MKVISSKGRALPTEKKPKPATRPMTDWKTPGLRERVATLVPLGFTDAEIASTLAEEFGVTVSPGAVQHAIRGLRLDGVLPEAKRGGGSRGRKHFIAIERYIEEQRLKWYNPKYSPTAEGLYVTPLDRARAALIAAGRLTVHRGMECLDGKPATVQQIIREGREAVLAAGGRWEGGRPDRW